MGCPRAHVDVQFAPWCILGASSVHPWCILGASLVHPWCILGASSHLSIWSRGQLWAFQKVLGARVGCTSALNGRPWPPHEPSKASLGAFLEPSKKCLGLEWGAHMPQMAQLGPRIGLPKPLFSFIFRFNEPFWSLPKGAWGSSGEHICPKWPTLAPT